MRYGREDIDLLYGRIAMVMLLLAHLCCRWRPLWCFCVFMYTFNLRLLNVAMRSCRSYYIDRFTVIRLSILVGFEDLLDAAASLGPGTNAGRTPPRRRNGTATRRIADAPSGSTVVGRNLVIAELTAQPPPDIRVYAKYALLAALIGFVVYALSRFVFARYYT